MLIPHTGRQANPTSIGVEEVADGLTRTLARFPVNARANRMMPEIEEVLVSVWRQALVDGANSIVIDGTIYLVKTTARRGLKQVDFRFEGHELRGLEQNPDTKSKWAAMAREGRKVMQFLESGRYIAVVVDGKMTTYR